MNISDELERLDKLRKDGSLSEDEFAQAKSKLLNEQDMVKPTLPPGCGPPDPVNWDFPVQMVLVLLVAIFFFIFLLLVWPHMRNCHWNG